MIALASSIGTNLDASGEIPSEANHGSVAGETRILLHSVPVSEHVTFRAPLSPVVVTAGIDQTDAKPFEARQVTGTTSADVSKNRPSYAQSPWPNKTDDTLKPYIAPDSLADMVRSGSPRQSIVPARKFETGLSMPSDLETRFDDTREFDSTHSINHVGRPIHSDAVNVRTPDFDSSSDTSQFNPIVSDASKLSADFSKPKIDTSSLQQRTRRIADKQGFQMFSMESLQPPPAEVSLPEAQVSTANNNAIIHAKRLRKLAQAALADSRSRLQRRATHTARKHALEALRLSIDIEDALAGGNQHVRDLRIAQNAIREAKDFEGVTTTVDWRSIQRMVAVHETEILKSQDLKTLSAVQATDAYLNLARTKLVSAAGHSALAAESMLLLGMIEKQVLSREDVHSGAVSLTYHGAATEIQPSNAEAHREYGRTLLEQGLVRQSILSLKQSVAIQPSRTGYHILLNASRRGGDYDLAQQCIRALDDPSLFNDTAVVQLPPSQFAASYRPTPQTINAIPATSSPKPDVKDPEPDQEKTRISFRSFFPFGRR
ncbi:hypothetical protein LF1_32040 [Rubripirellula obstinata]|uniref:Tetratricopeptide repeat protein n=2 Tax=Rubripirellula obstinata TaxID=406547 RepID=A0A5B1CN18_9BACT|nr:hypothetical protein LF1_32040 [Rubripirellula obstinata]